MEIQDLLGRPIHSPEIKDFFAQYHLPQKPNPEYDAYGNLFWVRVNNEENTIRCLFTGYVRYAPAYGEPIGNYNKEKDQLILHEITIYPPATPNVKISDINLPFGLNIGDDKTTIEQKIGKKLTRKEVSDYGSTYDVLFEEFSLLVALNPQEQLDRLMLFKLELYEKKRIRLKALLKSQNKNIDPNRIPEIQAFLSETPITQWRQRMAEGDDMFSEESITAVETVLTEYVQRLCEAVHKKNATTVYNSMGKLVKKLNKINDKYGLIETMERRVAWLQDVALELDLDNVTIRRARAEEVRDRFDAVTARAVANLTKLVRITAPILRRGGCLLALKGAKAEVEAEAAKYVIKKAKLDPAIIHEVVTPGEELTKVVEVRRPKR